jgi:hypothetical protein
MNINDVVSILTSLSIISGGIYFLVKEYKQQQKKYRQKLNSNWTNEGDVSLVVTHYMDMNLSVDIEDGEIVGLLKTRNINTEREHNNISVNGKLKFKTATIQLSDYQRGKHIDYGKVRIELTRNGKMLKWKLIKGYEDLIPKTTVMW